MRLSANLPPPLPFRSGLPSPGPLPYLGLTASNSTFVVAADEVQALLYSFATLLAPPSFAALASIAPFRAQLPLQVGAGNTHGGFRGGGGGERRGGVNPTAQR